MGKAGERVWETGKKSGEKWENTGGSGEKKCSCRPLKGIPSFGKLGNIARKKWERSFVWESKSGKYGHRKVGNIDGVIFTQFSRVGKRYGKIDGECMGFACHVL